MAAEEVHIDVPEKKNDPCTCKKVSCFILNYTFMTVACVVVCYFGFQELMTSLTHPVSSITKEKVGEYMAPGIAVWHDEARLVACENSNKSVNSKEFSVPSQGSCKNTSVQYTDPHDSKTRKVMIFRGPVHFTGFKRDSISFQFELQDSSSGFFTISYIVFSNYDAFAALPRTEQTLRVQQYYREKPSYSLSAGLYSWIQLSLLEKHSKSLGQLEDTFNAEVNVVKYHDNEEDKKNFFASYQWKSNFKEISFLLTTTTKWSYVAAVCGIILAIHKIYSGGQKLVKRWSVLCKCMSFIAEAD